MKRILIPALMTLALLNTIQAQSLTLDETVAYINSQNERIGGSSTISAEKNGHIKENFKNGELIIMYNLFDIELKYETNDEGEHIISWECINNDCIYSIDDDGDKRFRSSIRETLISQSEINKMIKAYNHLRTLCKKEVDPFD